MNIRNSWDTITMSKMTDKKQNGPRKYTVYSCNGCEYCTDKFDDHWIALHCTHKNVDKSYTLVGYADEDFPFPRKFKCPINGKIWDDTLPVRRV